MIISFKVSSCFFIRGLFGHQGQRKQIFSSISGNLRHLRQNQAELGLWLCMIHHEFASLIWGSKTKKRQHRREDLEIVNGQRGHANRFSLWRQSFKLCLKSCLKLRVQTVKKCWWTTSRKLNRAQNYSGTSWDVFWTFRFAFRFTIRSGIEAFSGQFCSAEVPPSRTGGGSATGDFRNSWQAGCSLRGTLSLQGNPHSKLTLRLLLQRLVWGQINSTLVQEPLVWKPLIGFPERLHSDTKSLRKPPS